MKLDEAENGHKITVREACFKLVEFNTLQDGGICRNHLQT